MTWYLVKHRICLHGMVLSEAEDVFMAWYIIKQRIYLHGLVLSQAQGQF